MIVENSFVTADALDGLTYQKFDAIFSSTQCRVHVITYDQKLTHLKLILSKTSEALEPNSRDNHTGEGGTLEDLVHTQPDLRFAVNGTYNHYRKEYYQWHHNDYRVGDPAGFVKIRDHLYDDNPHKAYNGYLQRTLNKTWEITDSPDITSKYILSSRPLLIHNGENIVLPLAEMEPAPPNTVTPPSFLHHGLQHHARTAIGVKGDNLLFVIAESEETETSKGVTLPQLQELGSHHGLESFLNLDGGGSSRFWLKDEGGDFVQSLTAPDDENRILGNMLMLFSTTQPN